MDELRRRRWWLLTKALESHPISEALEIAHAVERFLVGAELAVGGEGPSRAPLLRGEWQTAVLGTVEPLAEMAARAPDQPAADGEPTAERSETAVAEPIGAHTDQQSDTGSACHSGDTLAAAAAPASLRYLH